MIDIEIKNCNNIDSGRISIAENLLNIKYAPNGTGKSTIAKAIICGSSGQIPPSISQNELKPFKHLSDAAISPSITGNDSLQKVKVFDELYISDVVYRPDELIKGSFEIFIKCEDYDRGIAEIEELTRRITTTLREDDDIKRVVKDFTDLISSFGKETLTGIHGSSGVAKAFREGNRVENVPADLIGYKDFIQNGALNYKWAKWQIDGKDYLDLSDNCPYCVSPVASKKETIKKIAETYKPKEIESLNAIVKTFKSLEDYFSDPTRTLINRFVTSMSGYTNQESGLLLEIREQISRILTNILDLQSIGFSSLKNVETIAPLLTSKIIDIALYVHLDSTKTRQKIGLINALVQELIDAAGQLQGKVARHKALINERVRENCSEINTFLSNAGFSYNVRLDDTDGSNHKLKLIHRQGETVIDSAKSHLSFGERNAFAIVMFMYDALRDDPDLIILDDPISSFDKNKKYAIIEMLFRRSKSLRGKTVLLLTHDFDPIVDMLLHHSDRFIRPSCTFLKNSLGNLVELEVSRSDVKAFLEIIDDNLSLSIPVINQLVYLRRYLEVTNDRGAGYQLLSNVFKKRTPPLIKDGESFREMTTEEVSQGEGDIRTRISNFYYQEISQQINDQVRMMEAYQNCSNNYEKLHIFRIITACASDAIESDVIKKFINESFHIENNSIYQLDPRKYQSVPKYIISECDRILQAQAS